VARWVLTNGIGYDLVIESVDDLVRGLAEVDELARNQRRGRVAVLAFDNDAVNTAYLSFGVGADDSVLVYEAGEGDGGYSKGPRVGDTTSVTFAYGTGSTEYVA
jgi:hypothetical protein